MLSWPFMGKRDLPSGCLPPTSALCRPTQIWSRHRAKKRVPLKAERISQGIQVFIDLFSPSKRERRVWAFGIHTPLLRLLLFYILKHCKAAASQSASFFGWIRERAFDDETRRLNVLFSFQFSLARSWNWYILEGYVCGTENCLERWIDSRKCYTQSSGNTPDSMYCNDTS